MTRIQSRSYIQAAQFVLNTWLQCAMRVAAWDKEMCLAAWVGSSGVTSWAEDVESQQPCNYRELWSGITILCSREKKSPRGLTRKVDSRPSILVPGKNAGTQCNMPLLMKCIAGQTPINRFTQTLGSLPENVIHAMQWHAQYQKLPRNKTWRRITGSFGGDYSSSDTLLPGLHRQIYVVQLLCTKTL